MSLSKSEIISRRESCFLRESLRLTFLLRESHGVVASRFWKNVKTPVEVARSALSTSNGFFFLLFFSLAWPSFLLFHSPLSRWNYKAEVAAHADKPGEKNGNVYSLPRQRTRRPFAVGGPANSIAMHCPIKFINWLFRECSVRRCEIRTSDPLAGV